MANLGKIVYLSEAQKDELFALGSVTSNGTTITYNQNDIYVTPDKSINTIRVNGQVINPINGTADLGSVKADYSDYIENVAGTAVTITGEANYRYICGEVVTLSVTPPAKGTIDVIFSSGSTATVLTLPNTVKMPEWWTGPETDHTYELIITDGVYGAVMSWAD